MKNKILKIRKGIMLIMLFLFPMLSIGQITDKLPDKPDDKLPVNPGFEVVHNEAFYQKAIEFMQGEGILETWFTEGFLPLYDEFMEAEYGLYISVGQAIAAIAALIYLGWIGWGMMAGDREWQVLPLLKPFAIGMVLMFWVQFVYLIREPLVLLQESAQSDFNESQQELNALRVTRYKYQMMTVDALISEKAKAKAEIEQQEAGNPTLIEQGLDLIGDGITSLLSPVYELYLRLQAEMQMVVAATLETIGLWILRICTYLIFFIQLMFSTILIMVGPIAVGLSIFPMFSQSFATWVARFINVNMYGFMAFIILKLGTILQRFAFEAEIDRYKELVTNTGAVKNMDLLLTYSSGGTMTFGLVIISFVISGIGVLMVPTLANYVVNASANANTMSKMKRGAMAAATMGKSLLIKR